MRYVENHEHDLNDERRARLAADRRHDRVERDIVLAAKLGRQDADDAPVVGAAHREEKMEAALPEIDVDFVRHHRAGHLDVGDEEDVLVRRAGEGDRVELADRAVRTVAAGDPRGFDLARRSVGHLQRRGDAIGALLERDQLGVPLHGAAERAQALAHDALVVVLAEDQDVRIRCDLAPGIAERYVAFQDAVGPQVCAVAGRAELERAPDDAELLVDLERACLHAERARLARGTTVAVDEQITHAASRELVRQHQSRRTGADDEDIDIHRGFSQGVARLSADFSRAVRAAYRWARGRRTAVAADEVRFVSVRRRRPSSGTSTRLAPASRRHGRTGCRRIP